MVEGVMIKTFTRRLVRVYLAMGFNSDALDMHRTPFNAKQGLIFMFPDGPILSGHDCLIFVGIAPTLRGEPKILSGKFPSGHCNRKFRE